MICCSVQRLSNTQYLCASSSSDSQMANATDSPIPYGNQANGDTEQESSKNHEVVRSFRPTTEERMEPDTLLTARASTRDLKESDEPTSVGPAHEGKMVRIEGGSLSESADAALHLKIPFNHGSGPSTTHDQRIHTKKTFHARKMVCDPSKESLDEISAPSQIPIPLVTFGVQNDSSPFLAVSADWFSHEKRAMSSHREHSISAEHKSTLNTLIIKRERQKLIGVVNIPRLVVPGIADDAINLRNNTEVRNVNIVLDLKHDSKKEKSSRTTSLRPGPYMHDAIGGQTELAQMSTAAKDPSSLNCESLAKKLDIDLTVVKPTCVGLTRKGSRCKCSISKSNWKNVHTILYRLVGFDPCYDAGIYAKKLKLLACLILCQRNHQDQAIDLAEAWESLLSGSVQGINEPKLPDRDLRSHTSTVEVKQELKMKQISGTVDDLELSTNRPVDIEFSPQRNRGIKTIIRSLVPYDAKIKNKIDTVSLIKGVIMKDLSPRDIAKDGFIYIYWFPVNFGHIKIGVTTRSIEVRLREWKKQCGHEPELVYPKSPEVRQRIPHVFRVEAIVQAELREFRRKELKCKTCYRAHKEWFEKSTPAAITAVKRWSAWMRTEPYEPSGRLKDEHKQDLRNIRMIVPDAEARSPSPRPRQRIRQPRSDRIDSRFRSHSEQPRRRSSRLRMRGEAELSGK